MTAFGPGATRPGAPGPVLPPARRDPTALLVPNATLIEREDITASVARIVVGPDEPVAPFAPGQYFALGLPVDGRLLQRPYSTASLPPASDGLEFLVRLVPGGALTPRLWGLRAGARLRIGRPKGLFQLVPDDGRAHLLVATGTGLAPFIAMAAELRSRPAAPRTVVVHGVAHADELAFRDRLEAWRRDGSPFAYLPAVSRPADPGNAGWTGLTGRLDGVLPAVVSGAALDPGDLVAYLCGNPAMIESVTAGLRRLGVAADAIIAEQYWAGPAGFS